MFCAMFAEAVIAQGPTPWVCDPGLALLTQRRPHFEFPVYEFERRSPQCKVKVSYH